MRRQRQPHRDHGKRLKRLVTDLGAGATGDRQNHRTCVYDRAGLGWSEPSPQPRTAATIVEELHTLLVNGDIAGPYVLVGHSIGGAYVRLYAHNYPKRVVGMVLVDSSHEAQSARLPAEIVQLRARQGAEQIEQELAIYKPLAKMGLLALAHAAC
ncbi:MAG: alpha/beta fold hydrolase [Caldilineaceae bacterium]